MNAKSTIDDLSVATRIEIAAFYVFHRLNNFTALQEPILVLCKARGIKGMLLVASEGLNGTLSGKSDDLKAVLTEIAAVAGTGPLPVKTSFAPKHPFNRIKVRLKQEIVTIGDTTVDPLQQVGTYVEPEHWNALLADPDVVLIDTRNSFEYGFGTFRGAVDPKTSSFSEFPAFVKDTLDPARHRKIAMFCTGGIRCEKASSYMLREGFEEVFHLKGGILAYLEHTEKAESLWEGSCFVFDERLAVEHDLKIADVMQCLCCDRALQASDLLAAEYERGVSCSACFSNLTEDRKASARERQKQIKLAELSGRRHLGPQE